MKPNQIVGVFLFLTLTTATLYNSIEYGLDWSTEEGQMKAVMILTTYIVTLIIAVLLYTGKLTVHKTAYTEIKEKQIQMKITIKGVLIFILAVIGLFLLPFILVLSGLNNAVFGGIIFVIAATAVLWLTTKIIPIKKKEKEGDVDQIIRDA